MKGRIEQTDIAKGIGIILVVVGHAFPDSTQLVNGSFSYMFYKLIYSFHMPFFFFISGLVSAGIVGCSGVREKIDQVKKKVVRLLVPYFVFGVIFIPLRIIFAEFARFSYDFTKLYTVFLGNNPCGQLWFLYTLFLFSLTAIFFSTKKNIKYLTLIAFAVTVLSPVAKLKYDGIVWSNVLFMLFFYYLGLFISQYHNKLYSIVKVKLLYAVIPFFVLCFFVFMKTDGNHLAKIFTSVSGIYIMLCVSQLIYKHGHSRISGFLKEIGSYSMDVYIFHSPMGVVWRILLLNLLNVNAYVYMTVYIITGVIGSYLISKYIVRKIPIFSLLFLGMSSSKKPDMKNNILGVYE